MKKILTLLFNVILFIVITIISLKANEPLSIDAYEVLDTSRLVIRYSFEFVADADKPTIIDEDILILEIGNKISKSYSYGLYKHDSIATMNKNSSGVPGFRARVPAMEVFKNYPESKNSIVHRASWNTPIFWYEDEVNIEWTILPERKQIAGYSCQKAITNFRGRAWETWFTNQIPVSDGPWKFHGLPGMILELSDSKKHFKFSCVGISQDKVPIKKWKWNYEKTTRERANEYLIRCHERVWECAQNLGISIRIPGRSPEEAKKISTPYNPLELE
jgi:GLPGLI family protein